jgi:hypothetical protein
VNSCFRSRNKKDLRNITVNRYQFVSNNESIKNTNLKPDTNKLSRNKNCQFLENFVTRGNTQEQKPNGYCNAEVTIYVAIQQMLPVFVALWYFLLKG